MKAANMRAQLVAQIAGQIAGGRMSNPQPLGPDITAHVVNAAQEIVGEVERRLGEPIYKDRSWESQEQS